MITRIGVAPRRAGLGTAAFQAHWAGTHGAVVARLVGVTRYWQNHALLDGGEPLLPWPGFDACSDIDFPDLATMRAAFSSAQYLDAVKADEGVLVEKDKGGLMLSRRVAARGDTGPKGVRLWRFLRAAPNVAVEHLHTALAAAPPLAAARGQERFEALPEADTGVTPIFDAAETFWFAEAAAALAALRSVAMRERSAAFAGLVRGSEHLLAQVHVVPVPSAGAGNDNAQQGGKV